MGKEDCNQNGTLRARLGQVHSSDPTGYKNITITRDGHKDSLQITFHRTVRVPDHQNTYELPPDLGDFPLYSVEDYREAFPNKLAAKGGMFFPMYREYPFSLSFFSLRSQS